MTGLEAVFYISKDLLKPFVRLMEANGPGSRWPGVAAGEAGTAGNEKPKTRKPAPQELAFELVPILEATG